SFCMSILSSHQRKYVYVFFILLFVLSNCGHCSAQSLFSKHTAIQGETATMISAQTYTLFTSKQIDNHHRSLFSSQNLSATHPQGPHSTTLAQSNLPTHAKETRTNAKEVYFGWLNWTGLIVYFLGMLYLGGLFFKKGDHPDNFFKGGGRIPWWAASISIFATMFSAITYMSIPAKVYATDWTYYPIQFMMLFILYPVVKYYLPFFRRLNVTTAYAYLQCRFNYALRCMASLLFMAFMVARMALILFLPALALSAVADIDISLCILLMAVITIIYCTLGGIEAVIWADVIQGIILVGGAILAAIYLIWQTPGGFQGFVDIGVSDHKFVLFDWSLDYRSATFWVVILGGLANNLISYTSDQTIIQRYMTTKDERSAARSIVVNGVICVVVSIVFYLIGTGLYTFFKTHPDAGFSSLERPDAIFPFYVVTQLPAGVAGLLIAALFAATMSTISSNINSISTSFTIDIYQHIRPTRLSSKHILRVARWASFVSGIAGLLIALLMAQLKIQSLLDYFNIILGLLSGCIGGLFVMGIFFPTIGSKSATIGFVSGMLIVFYLHFYTQVSFLIFGFVSIAASVSVALLFSILFK
ncbi:MAG: sodium:solute symporter, partial [Alloprevotella tannerae]|nr:sodium:solute symporter [Alloprevotella tannerae]